MSPFESAVELMQENENLKQENNELCTTYTRLCDLIDVQNEYINLLLDELNDAVPLASSLGWESSRYKKGVLLREIIRKTNWEIAENEKL